MNIEKIKFVDHKSNINKAIDLAMEKKWEELIESMKNYLNKLLSNKPNIENADNLIELTEQLNDFLISQDIPDNLSEEINNLKYKIYDAI